MRSLRGAGLAVFAVVAASLAGAVPANAQAPLDDPREWLERMVEAAQALNYDGTLVYQSGTSTESMRIIHRRDENGERERLLSLTGVAREVLRDNRRVTCIFPDDGSVVVGKNRARGVNRGPLFSGVSVPDYYDLRMRGLDRVAGRVAERVDLEPKDEYRYGFKLWIDRSSGLLLRNEVIGSGQETLESVAYTSVSLPKDIPDHLLEPGISGAGFRWVTWEEAVPSAAQDRPESAWRVGWLPRGFKLSERGMEQRPGARAPTEHMVYSDGLASLSIFIEELDATGMPLDGHSRMGAMSAFGRMIGRHQLTVVGEVPAVTVEGVGLGIEAPRE